MKTFTMETLIKKLSDYGVKITTRDISEIMKIGLDTFLLRRGEQIPDKNLDELYLIIHELRELGFGSNLDHKQLQNLSKFEYI
jgi:hypothetical protein